MKYDILKAIKFNLDLCIWRQMFGTPDLGLKTSEVNIKICLCNLKAQMVCVLCRDLPTRIPTVGRSYTIVSRDLLRDSTSSGL